MPSPTTFSEYVTTLPAWEHEILQSLEYHFDEDDILHMISSNIKVYFVSNSKEHEGVEYFGWVIVTSMDILVTNKGQAK
eukprot:10888641-Ditylum_brightwellii.AAC.1